MRKLTCRICLKIHTRHTNVNTPPLRGGNHTRSQQLRPVGVPCAREFTARRASFLLPLAQELPYSFIRESPRATIVSSHSVSFSQHIAHIELHKPPVNALDHDFVLELTGTARRLAARNDVWVVTITSSLPTFCAGADLKERAAMHPSRVGSTVRAIQRMVKAWFALPQPVIAGIRGAALGGGLEFALAADLIAVAEDAVLGFPEVTLGIIPAAGGTQLLSFRTSQSVATRWVLTGRRFSGREAYREGIADFVFPDDGFTASFDELVTSIAGHAPLALRQAKKALRGAHRATLDRRLTYERNCYTPLIRTEDRAEALRAFLEKRSPKWNGR